MSSTLLTEDWLGDVKCPECQAILNWDEDRLSSFHPELAVCSVCEHEFVLTRKIKYTFEYAIKEN